MFKNYYKPAFLVVCGTAIAFSAFNCYQSYTSYQEEQKMLYQRQLKIHETLNEISKELDSIDKSLNESDRLTQEHLNEPEQESYSEYSFNVNEPSNITAYELNKFLEGTPLAGLGHDFVKAELETGVNAIFLASVATIESGWGKSNLAQDKNNIFGFCAYDDSPYDSALAFDTKGECIAHVAKYLAKHYCDENGQYYRGGTIADIGPLYASNPSWASQVYGMTQQITNSI